MSRTALFLAGVIVAVLLFVPDGRDLLVDGVKSVAEWVLNNVDNLRES